MIRSFRLAAAVGVTLVFATPLAACAAESAPQPTAPQAASTAAVAPSPRPLTELPAWAQQGSVWLIYPDGLTCTGTEGCPNDFRAVFGEPGPVLPDGVEVFDPAKHDWVAVSSEG